MMGIGALFRNTQNVEITVSDVEAGTSLSETFTISDGFPTWRNRGPYQGGMSIPGARRAALLLSDLLAAVPWKAYRETPDGHSELVFPTPDLIRQPAPPDIRMTTISSLLLDLFWHGNGIALKLGYDARGNVSSLLPVAATSVFVERVLPGSGIDLPIGNIAYYIGDPRYQINQWFDSSEIMHVKGPCAPGDLRGMGLIETCLQVLDLAQEQARQASAVTGAGIPLGTLKSDNPDLTKPEADALKSAWLNAQRERSIAVLNATTSFEALAWNPTEAQLLEARKFTLHEIALMAGLDPSWLGVAGSSQTYSNVEIEAINLVKFSLGSPLARLEGALSTCLEPGTYAQANLDALLRGDTLTRYQAHNIGITAGFLTDDEARRMEDLPPLTPEQRKVIEAKAAALKPAPPLAADLGKGARSEQRDESDLWLYWTAGRGRAKWSGAKEPLSALYDNLIKHMDPTKARASALAWFEDALGRKPTVGDGQLPGGAK